MTINEGMADRIFRIVAGSALLLAAYFYLDTIYVHVGWLGGILFATGIIGWCPLYRLLGISTDSTETQRRTGP